MSSFQASGKNFIKILLAFITFSLIASSWLISRAINEEKSLILYELYLRAESLAWSIEGGTRYLFKRHSTQAEELLVEIARQPGVAWVALLDKEGRIMLDSNPELRGTILYTSGELAELAPDNLLKGRFSPDDPDIFEAWKIFRTHLKKDPGIIPAYLFIALDAGPSKKGLNGYISKLIIIYGLVIFILSLFFILLYYIYHYRLSRREFKETKALAEEIIKNFPAGLMVVDKNGIIKLSNPRAREMLNLCSKNIAITNLPGLDWESVWEEMTDQFNIINRNMDLLQDNKFIPINLVVAPIFNESQNDADFLVLLHDMKKINLLKEQLAKTKRLSELGKLASGIAHEIRNPLSSICGYAHYLAEKLSTDPIGKETARLLEEEAQRLDRVLSELLSLSRPPRLEQKITDIEDIILRAIQILNPDTEDKHIVLKFEKPAIPIQIAIDPDKFLQALLNLILNAIQATPENGKIFISLKTIFKDKNDWCLIKIKDTGCGMSEKIKSQIFTPYFTTRPEGTGLGLPFVQQIVEAHKGIIRVESLPGVGSTFEIMLPLN